MKSIKRIVVGIDFSEYSKKILDYASGLAEQHSAEIVAVNVINKQRIEDVRTAINDEQFSLEIMDKYIESETKRRMLNMADLIGEVVSPKVSIRTVIGSGTPFEEILKVIDEEDAELLVISSRGRTNFQDYMYGTTAEKLFRHSPVSILSLNLN